MKEFYPNIPRLYTALAEWMACMVYISRCPKRVEGTRFWLTAAAGLLVQCLWLEATGELPISFWIPCMAASAGLMFLLTSVCCDVPPVSAGYCTIRAFLMAELIASLEWQLYFYTASELQQMESTALSWSMMLIFYIVAYYAIYLLEKRWNWGYTTGTFLAKDLWPPVIIGLTAFSVSNLSFVYTKTPFSGSDIFDIHNIRTLVDLAGTAMLYSYHAQRGEASLERELGAIKNVLDSQYAQYQQSKASIDIINQKYHDLKHQIAILRAEKDDSRRTAFLDELEDEIRIYDTQFKTGNTTLDTVLTGKGMICTEHQIHLTCIADGRLLNFMSVMDISTMFGNMLDNAIECEQTIADAAKRAIHVNITSQKGFLVIRAENYFEGELRLQNGLPVTTKQDQNYHGFGIKSIRYTAEKYGGSIVLDTKNNWFGIRLLIPLPQK